MDDDIYVMKNSKLDQGRPENEIYQNRTNAGAYPIGTNVGIHQNGANVGIYQNGTSFQGIHSECFEVKSANQDEIAAEYALSCNLELQKEIKNTLAAYEDMLWKNSLEQERIEEEHINEMTTVFKTNRKPITLFAHPYFRTANGMTAPENADAVYKRRRNDVDAYLQPPRPWTGKEHIALAKAVYDNAIKLMMKPLANREAFLKEKLETQHLGEEEEEQIKQSIEDIREQMQLLKKKPKLELFEELEGKLDWLNISTVNMRGTRTPEDCELMWKNFLHPKINRSKFLPNEDSKLMKLVEKRDGKNWDEIAKELKTNRTAIQCLERHQGYLNKDMLKSFWTSEEDEYLKSVVESLQVGNQIPWHQVAYFMEGRTRSQVYSRWHRHIKPESRIAKWTKEEDAILCAAYEQYGRCWKKIGKFLPRRTNYNCRERYINSLFPGRCGNSWTIDDDRTLIETYVKFSEGQWPRIAGRLLCRNGKSCAKRLNNMKKKSPVKFAAAVEKCQSGMDRESFMPQQIIRTKSLPAVGARRKRLRNQALETLKIALMELNGQESVDNNITFKSISLHTLKQLSDHLLADQNYEQRCKRPRYRSLESHARRQIWAEEDKELRLRSHSTLQNSSSSSDNNSNSSCCSDEEKEDDTNQEVCDMEKVTHDEEVELEKELYRVLKPKKLSGASCIHRRFVFRSEKEWIQQKALMYVLRKAFHIKNNPFPGIEEELGDTVSQIEDVLNMVVMPLFCDEDDYGSIPVVPPNYATLCAQLCMMAVKSNLESSANNLTGQGIENLKYILANHSSLSRKCEECRNADVQQKHVPGCYCEELHKSRERVIILRERFLSVFLWPFLLAHVRFSKEQMSKLILCEAETITLGDENECGTSGNENVVEVAQEVKNRTKRPRMSSMSISVKKDEC